MPVPLVAGGREQGRSASCARRQRDRSPEAVAVTLDLGDSLLAARFYLVRIIKLPVVLVGLSMSVFPETQ